jgi:hypothetical protein
MTDDGMQVENEYEKEFPALGSKCPNPKRTREGDQNNTTKERL